VGGRLANDAAGDAMGRTPERPRELDRGGRLIRAFWPWLSLSVKASRVTGPPPGPTCSICCLSPYFFGAIFDAAHLRASTRSRERWMYSPFPRHPIISPLASRFAT
jgi:hypothetical protein